MLVIKMRKRLKWAVPTLALTIAIFLKISKNVILKYIWKCSFYENTGFWCPGCGNTRAVFALLKGNIIKAAGCNAGFMLMLLLLIMIYIRFLFDMTLLPEWAKKPLFWIVIGIILASYYIARNFIPILYIPNSI